MSDAAQTAWAAVLMRSLHEAGVRELIVSPGSRSTPLVIAAVEAGIRCRAIVDERSAGFFALGLGRASGAPAALLCTSGSAAAHYYPAVIEADAAAVPLIVITADRPPELAGCGANQTIDQSKLFGDRVRRFFDLGPATETQAALRAVRRKAAQACFYAGGSYPGPVHLNVPLRKPLEPVAAGSDLASRVCQEPLTTVSTPRQLVAAAALEALAADLSRTERGVIIAGPAPIAHARLRQSIAYLSQVTGYPVFAEATSQLRLVGEAVPALGCDAFDVFLGWPNLGDRIDAELIVQLGAAPTSRSLANYLARSPARRYVLTEHGWPDPSSDATAMLFGDVGDAAVRLAAAVDERGPTSWAAAMLDLNRRGWQRVEGELGLRSESMSEGQALRAIVAALPDDALLFIGNSLPVRLIDTFCPAKSARVDVLSQRGASGIDGLISGAAGAASAGALERPVVLVMGDVSFAHDLCGLAAARHIAAPLSIIVIDNGGGRIFDQLPIANTALPNNAFERFFTTAPGLDIAAAAGLFGHWVETARRPDELAAAITDTVGSPGCTVVHAVVDPHSARASLARLREEP